MKKYQCYYHEVGYIGDRGYLGSKIIQATFDDEEEAERYCDSHVGIQEFGDGSYEERELNYEIIEE